ncbi:MAG: hypothetical protein AAB756_00585 [Patescibacteria group bacterium]
MSNELMLDVGQAKEIKDAFRREKGSNGSVWTNEKIKIVTEKRGFLGSALDVLEGRAKIIAVEVKAKTTPRISPIIRVNRKIRPVYPDWADQKWINSAEFMALEATGPAKFDASKLEQWLHDDQKDGRVTGDIIYEHHKKNDMLKDDLGLHDLEEIKKKGVAFFRVHFQGKAVFGWKSVVLGRDGRLSVPCLVADGGEVVLFWRWLGDDWRSGFPALRFAK